MRAENFTARYVKSIVNASVALSSFIAVVAWSDARHLEREAYYKSETLKKIADSPGDGGKTALKLMREEERIKRGRILEGQKLGGLVMVGVRSRCSDFPESPCPGCACVSRRHDSSADRSSPAGLRLRNGAKRVAHFQLPPGSANLRIGAVDASSRRHPESYPIRIAEGSQCSICCGPRFPPLPSAHHGPHFNRGSGSCLCAVIPNPLQRVRDLLSPPRSPPVRGAPERHGAEERGHR